MKGLFYCFLVPGRPGKIHQSGTEKFVILALKNQETHLVVNSSLKIEILACLQENKQCFQAILVDVKFRAVCQHYIVMF